MITTVVEPISTAFVSVRPDQPAPNPHLVLAVCKDGSIYVVNRDAMGHFNAGSNNIVQGLPANTIGGGWTIPAYWNGHVYFASSDDSLRDYAIENGQLKLKIRSSIKFENPGATPSISAARNKNAIVWAIATKTWNGPNRPAVLYAFDAKDVGEPLYTSEQNGRRDQAGMATRFATPLVVKGHVYFGTREEVEVYGLLK